MSDISKGGILMTKDETQGLSTRCVHTGSDPEAPFAHGSVMTPIFQTTSFAFPSIEVLQDFLEGRAKDRFIYTRTGNPTVRAAELKLAGIEGGDDSVILSSGMAGITTAVMSSLKAGDEILSLQEIYGKTAHFFTRTLPDWGVKVRFVKATDLDSARTMINEKTKVFYIETPTNPTLRVVDMKHVAEISQEFGLTSIIDGTFGTPFNQQPLKAGIDLVVHSGTKYLSGHSNITSGAIVGNDERITKARDHRMTFGGILDPFGAYLLLLGLKTLAIRVEKQNSSALEIARFLEAHPKIKVVHYPGLESHPQHEIAKRQMKGFGGMIAFEVDGGLEGVKAFANDLNLILRATSLGGVESLMTIPVLTTHRFISKEEREQMGVGDGLVRLSIGIEDKKDIIADLDHALAAI